MARQHSGLNLDLGDRCSRTAWTWASRTHAARRDKPGEVWGGLEASFASVVDLAGVKVGMTSDGIGTKVELAERTGVYRTLGFDLVAMVADDLAANGIEPTNLSNILDVDHLDEEIVAELMEGLSEAALSANIAVTGGEIAELGRRIGGWGERMHFNSCATAIGHLPAGREPVDGRRVRAGDAVVALRGRSFRSNGFSLARRVLGSFFGERWHEEDFDGRTWGEVLLTPSVVYAPFIARLLAAPVEVHAIAHITGGGVPDKFRRVLRPAALGAHLDALFEPPAFMRRLQELGDVPEEHAYRAWNMGNEVLLVLPEAEVERAVALAAEAGLRAGRAGEIVPNPILTLHGRGARPGELRFPVRGAR